MQQIKTIKIKNNDETHDNEPSIGKPYLQKINTVRQKYDKQRDEINHEFNDDRIHNLELIIDQLKSQTLDMALKMQKLTEKIKNQEQPPLEDKFDIAWLFNNFQYFLDKMTVDNAKIGMLKYNESYCLAFQDVGGKMW